MSFHNIRDKYGRFAPKGTSTPRARRKKILVVPDPVVSKDNHILNVFLLDDTGSMSSKVAATVEGFNQVVDDSIKASKDTGVKSTDILMLFGERGHLVVKDRLVKLKSFWSNGNVEDLTYNPGRGATALWWATVEALNKTSEVVPTLPIDTKVLFTIFTDGENNQAYEFESAAKVLIEDKKKLGWVINFIGAGEKAFIERISNSVGIFASNTLSYSNDSRGTKQAFSKMSASRSTYTANVAAGTATMDGFFSKD